MYKKPKNPQVEELTKSYRDRSISLGSLDLVKREDGLKGCVWCGDPLKSNHHAARYCKDGSCQQSALAWSYPQKEYGLFALLIRQDFKCNICQHDWKDLAQSIHNKVAFSYGQEMWKLGERLCYTTCKRLKAKVDIERRPEVDHIEPIYKGGQSIGLDNHQAICSHCHRAKTSKDLSGKRK